jgi:hypothetical protein
MCKIALTRSCRRFTGYSLEVRKIPNARRWTLEAALAAHPYHTIEIEIDYLQCARLQSPPLHLARKGLQSRSIARAQSDYL